MTPAIRNKDLYDKPNQFWNRSSLQKMAFLALTVWVAHFFNFRHFGLYEDDYALVSPAIGWSFSDLFDTAINVLLIWPQGRPLNFLLPPFFSFMGTQLGGLQPVAEGATALMWGKVKEVLTPAPVPERP